MSASSPSPARRRSVLARYAELQNQIGAEFALAIDPTEEDDFLLVDAQHGDERVAIGWLSSFLSRTIAEQEDQLDARMREVLQRYLFEGIGEELGDRIREARSLIGRMNHELDACPTPSGLRLHLRWDLAPDVPAGADRATDLLLLAPGTLSETDRDVIVRFLQARVADARSEESSTGFAEALITALDYRGWFAFSLEETNAHGRRHGSTRATTRRARVARRRSPSTCRCSRRSPPTTRARRATRPGCSSSTRRSPGSTGRCAA